MARGQNASTGRTARSEAGTVYRAETAQARINRAVDLLETFKAEADNSKFDEDKALTAMKLYLANNRAVKELTDFRPDREAYKIDIAESDHLKKVGKLNLMESTVDGKKIDYEYRQQGGFDRSGTKSTKSDAASDAFERGNRDANKENGFIFALDADKKLYAIPHTWDTNDPQGTVGIFRGDLIENNTPKGTQSLRVIGTFDASPRGLQLAAATAGSDIGRKNGVKQTAEIISSSAWQAESIAEGAKVGSYKIEQIAKAIGPAGRPYKEGQSKSGSGFKVTRIDPKSKLNNLVD
jgi:hypothetical protein